jgi:hypothetical protein
MTADIIPLEIERLGPQRIDDPTYWQCRANDARAKADQTSDTDAKAELVDAIAIYEVLVKWAHTAIRRSRIALGPRSELSIADARKLQSMQRRLGSTVV